MDDVRNGALSVYSSGHRYVIKNVAEDVAAVLIDSFTLFHDGGVLGDDEYLSEDYDCIIALKYSGIDALVWDAA